MPSIKTKIIKCNQKALKDLLKHLVKVAKVNDKYPNYAKLKENSIRIVMNKIFKNASIYEDSEIMIYVEVQLLSLYEVSILEKGILAPLRRKAYQMITFDNIVELLGMSKEE